MQKGSSAHFLLLAALDAAGVSLADIQPIYLAPAYGRTAFESDRVDAWVIWDPHLSSAQATIDSRVLADYSNLPETFGFYVAPRSFADHSSTQLLVVLDELATVGAWVVANPRAAAELLAPQVGLPFAVVEAWQRRARYGTRPIDAAVIASQQRIADAFFQHRLLSRRIAIADAVWLRERQRP